MKSIAKYFFGVLLLCIGLIPSARATSFTASGLEARCEDQVGVSRRLITMFHFDGSSLANSQKFLFRTFFADDISKNPLRSVSNDGSSGTSAGTDWNGPVYTIEKVQSTQGADELTLAGGGSLLIRQHPGSNTVQIFFVRPNGPEFPQVLDTCELLRREVGATAHN